MKFSLCIHDDHEAERLPMKEKRSLERHEKPHAKNLSEKRQEETSKNPEVASESKTTTGVFMMMPLKA
jgi:hypothetical protein